MRPRADTCQLDDSQSLQWSSHVQTRPPLKRSVTADISYLYNHVARPRVPSMTTTDSRTAAYTSIDDLSVDLADGVLSVTLNRPDSLNSLTAAMLKGIAGALQQAAGDPRVKVVRLGGAGRGFSSGAGISEEDHANPGASGTPADVLDAANDAVRSIVNLPQPAVAVVQGPAAGVGASLALACDCLLYTSPSPRDGLLSRMPSSA